VKNDHGWASDCVRSHRWSGMRGEQKTKANDNRGSTSQKEGTNQKKLRKCIPKYDKVPQLEITSTKIGQHIQKMQDYAIIGNFMGIWHSDKALDW